VKSYKFLINGRVQGVWYRASVQKNAQKLGFDGYVKNLSDGSVEAVVNCREERLAEFVSVLKKGSPLSRVENIVQSDADEEFGGGFFVRN
jgi:acylphosphatase